MAYVLRLIAAALLFAVQPAESAEVPWACNTYDAEIFNSYPGSDAVCRMGCWFDLEKVFNGKYHYQARGDKCSVPSQAICTIVEHKNLDTFQGYYFCSPDDKCAYQFGAHVSTPTEEYYGYVRTGEYCSPSGGGGSGGGSPGSVGDISNDDVPGCNENDGHKHHCIDEDGEYWNDGPEAPLCGRNEVYKHDCFDRGNGKYWDMNERYDICNHEEDDDEWHNCFYSDSFYRIEYWSSDHDNTWDSWYHYKLKECTYAEEDPAVLSYCHNRYGDSNEANLYDRAMFDDLNDKNVTEGMEGNTSINIRKKLGLTSDGDGSLSSTIPDLLEDKAPEKDGEFGTCLNDVEIEMFGQAITIPVSRACPWLKHLGTILIFLSLFTAISIIYRGGNEKATFK